MFPLLNHNIH